MQGPARGATGRAGIEPNDLILGDNERDTLSELTIADSILGGGSSLAIDGSIVSRLCRKLVISTLFEVRCLHPKSKLCLRTNSTSPSQSVKLDGFEDVELFLSRFPSRCRIYIRSLHVSMQPNEVTRQSYRASSQTDLLVDLLSTCTMIQSLTLYVFGSPRGDIIPPFARLTHLTSLFIGNVAPEQLMPL